MEKSGWAHAVEMDGCGVRGWGVMHVIGEKGVVLECEDTKVTLDELLEMKQQVARLRERVARLEGAPPDTTSSAVLISKGKRFVVEIPSLNSKWECDSLDAAMDLARRRAEVRLVAGKEVIVTTREKFEVVSLQ